MSETFTGLTRLIRDLYPTRRTIGLHEPVFGEAERRYVNDCLDTTMVSSVGGYVTRIERLMADLAGRKHGVSTCSGTAALHLALETCGVRSGDMVLTQAATFVATANAVSHCGAVPAFVDVDRSTLGLSPEALEKFLAGECVRDEGLLRHRASGRRIAAVVPVHVFGLIGRIDRLARICSDYDLPLVEDSAEALGSTFRGRRAGSFGRIGVFSFNGNKIVTTGGGGALVMDDDRLHEHAKKISTTAKVKHDWDFFHDEIAYNYRMPNLNAALGCAQLEGLERALADKRRVAQSYQEFLRDKELRFVADPPECVSNRWLNAVLCTDARERDRLLRHMHDEGIMARPLWMLMTELPMYASCVQDELTNSKWLRERLVCLPSGVREGVT